MLYWYLGNYKKNKKQKKWRKITRFNRRREKTTPPPPALVHLSVNNVSYSNQHKPWTHTFSNLLIKKTEVDETSTELINKIRFQQALRRFLVGQTVSLVRARALGVLSQWLRSFCAMAYQTLRLIPWCMVVYTSEPLGIPIATAYFKLNWLHWIRVLWD